MIRRSTVILFISLIVISNRLVADVYSTISSGDWSSSGTWNFGNVPPTTLNNSNVITISLGDVVVCASNITCNNNNELIVDGDLTINGDLLINNDFIIQVSGNLTINGSLTANNMAAIDILGNVLINGDLTFNNNSSINLDGSSILEVNGYVIGNNNNVLTGTGTLIAYGISGISYGGFTGDMILPIELLDFSVISATNRALIQWTTASELNNDYFTVEKSMDAVNFETITQISGAGTSNNSIRYEIIDDEVYSNQIVYYRLKQTDFDGKFKYFPVFPFTYKDNDEEEFTFFTNNNYLFIKILKSKNCLASITVYSLNGLQSIMNNYNLDEGDNLISIDISKLDKGAYFAILNFNSADSIYKFMR